MKLRCKSISLGPFAGCQRCGLHESRRQIVMGRGVLPADLLFVGEAPGKSEDLMGLAFVGPSGRLLNRAIDHACLVGGFSNPPTYYITNVVGCRPCDVKRGPNRQPTGEEALACFPRLKHVYWMVNPKHVVFLGKVAETYCKGIWPEATSLYHPAYILRLGGVESAQYKNFTRSLVEVFHAVQN